MVVNHFMTNRDSRKKKFKLEFWQYKHLISAYFFVTTAAAEEETTERPEKQYALLKRSIEFI
ncbi:hypothetical protein D918_04290 [Trichuris suis]|nr:hypothetical protein D918_04290 [Trichuris suis]